MIRPVLAIFLRKEWRDLRSNSQVLPGYLILPVVGVLLPMIMLAVMPLAPGAGAIDPDIVAIFRLAGRDPLLAAYPPAERLIRLVVREFGAFFLLMPVILSSMSAALAIAAEKQQRTLEPILATPVADRDLLLAKLIAAVVPAVAFTWCAALLYAIGVSIIGTIRVGVPILPGLPFLVAVGLLGPVGGVVAALIGMRASIRAVDVQAAVQSSGLWVVPAGIVLVGLIGRPAMRSLPIGIVGVVLLGALGGMLFRGNLKRFQREEILTRWK